MQKKSKENSYAPVPYGGGRDTQGIVQWVTKQTKSTLDVLASQNAVEEARKTASPNAVVVLYGESEAYSSKLHFFTILFLVIGKTNNLLQSSSFIIKRSYGYHFFPSQR